MSGPIQRNLASLASLLKDGSNHYRGLEEAVYRNIEAVKQLSKIVRTSMGPNGMNKMVINTHQKLFVTNDAATIIKELEVVHPAARMAVMAVKQQEQEIGDYTNLVTVLIGELLQQAEALLHMGLHVNDVITGYTNAGKRALELLEELVVEKVEDVKNRDQVIRAISASIASKQYGWEDTLAPLVADACISVLPSDPSRFSVDSIRVCKVLGGGVGDTLTVRGFALPKDSHGTIKHVKNAKVAVIACGLEMAKTETKGTVLIKSAKELLDFSAGEEKLMEQCIQEIANTGVNVIVSGGGVSDLAMHFAERFNLMVVKEASKFNLRRLCQTTGCRPLTRLGAPTPEEIGSCDEVSVDEIGSTKVCIFRQSPGAAGISTIIVRGSTNNILDDVERCIDDGVNCFKSIIRDQRLVAGAGAVEIELARRLIPFGEAVAGLDQYAFKRYAEALEVVPRTLAENAGLDSTAEISTLYAAHAAGNQSAGVNIEEGGVCNAVEKGIFDLLVGKSFALRLATDAAITILRVDQIIMAKAAGGPKIREMGARDEE